MKDELLLFWVRLAAIIFFGELYYNASEAKFSPEQDRSPDQPSLLLWRVYRDTKEAMKEARKKSKSEIQPFEEWLLSIADRQQLEKITADEFDEFVKSSPLRDDDLFWSFLGVVQDDGQVAYRLQQFLEEGITELQKWITIPGSLKPWRDWGLAIAKRRRRGRMTADELEKFMKSAPPRDESFVAVLLRQYVLMAEELAKHEMNTKKHFVERLQWVMYELDSAWNRWSARLIWFYDWSASLSGVGFLCLCLLSFFISMLPVFLSPPSTPSRSVEIYNDAMVILHLIVLSFYFGPKLLNIIRRNFC